MLSQNRYDELKSVIDTAYRDGLTDKRSQEAVNYALSLLEKGELRVAQKQEGEWLVNEWLKKAILLSFKYSSNSLIDGNFTTWFDKVALKSASWDLAAWRKAGFRSVAGSIVRYSAFVSPNTVLMPCFINVGAYVDARTMVDSWATIGSCAQIGKNCHISGGAGIGGVLEPLQASPVIIEDDCFIGARSEVAEGVIVKKGSVLSMGVYIGASTRIIDRKTEKIYYGMVPEYSVVVPGSAKGSKDSPINLYCAVIVKRVDEKTRAKTSINDLLRE